jgi:HAD superfamily hydrolase (TIGR01509 family)
MVPGTPAGPTSLATKQQVGGIIMDVDGVILASPHERAWREALEGIADPRLLTTTLYQTHVAGKPRLAGAEVVLAQLRLPYPKRLAPAYAQRKQERLSELIESGCFHAFPDAIRFIEALQAHGPRLAAASASKNANRMLEMIDLSSGQTLLDLFDANVCGRDVRHGKPDPELLRLAATELGVPVSSCIVIEDAPAGIAAAKAAGMAALGVARLGDQATLYAAGADYVVSSLDDIKMGSLLQIPARR